MLKSFNIPIKKKILIEKYIEDDVFLEENKYILEFLDKKNNVEEAFLVFSDLAPNLILEDLEYPGTYEIDRRVFWDLFDIMILENFGKNNGNKFLSWANKKNPEARNFILTKCYSNSVKSNYKWSLYGCTIEESFDYYEIEGFKSHGIGITLKINHGTIEV